MILDFVKFINTAMRKKIDWFVEEQDYRDLGMTWMSKVIVATSQKDG